MHKLFSLLSTIFFPILFFSVGANAQTTASIPLKNGDVYTVHIVPQYNVVQLHAEWTPLLARLSRDSGIQLKLVLLPTVPKFEHSLLVCILPTIFKHCCVMK